MGIFSGVQAGLKGAKAYRLHGNGDYEGARKLYEEAVAEGLTEPRYLLPYTVLLLRDGEYAKARQILVELNKRRATLNDEQQSQLMVNYAAAVFRMGEIDKAVAVLEKQHSRTPCGHTYSALGYLYVEKFEREPDFEQMDRDNAAAVAKARADQEAEKRQDAEDGLELTDEDYPEIPDPEPARVTWEKQKDAAEAFLREAVDYDEEDSVCLDNLAQFLYRVRGDKAAAKEWFDRAIAQKENQIDTLWFLAQYDLENGDRDAAVKKLQLAAAGRFSPLNCTTRDQIVAKLRDLGSS